MGDRQGACGNCEAQLRVGAEEERQEEGKKGREGGEAFPSPFIFGGHTTDCLIVSQTRPVPVEQLWVQLVPPESWLFHPGHLRPRKPEPLSRQGVQRAQPLTKSTLQGNMQEPPSPFCEDPHLPDSAVTVSSVPDILQ